MSVEAEKATIATHRSGTVGDPGELNGMIAETWRHLLSDPGQRSQIAGELGVPPGDIDPEAPIFEAEVGPSGILATTIAILVAKGFATGVGAAGGKVVGGAAIDRVREVWRRHVAPKLTDPGIQALGRESKEDKPTPERLGEP